MIWVIVIDMKKTDLEGHDFGKQFFILFLPVFSRAEKKETETVKQKQTTKFMNIPIKK